MEKEPQETSGVHTSFKNGFLQAPGGKKILGGGRSPVPKYAPHLWLKTKKKE